MAEEQREKPTVASEGIKASLEVDGRFKDLRIDYEVSFQSVKGSIREGLKKRKEAIAIIYLNQPGMPGLEPPRPAEIEILLGKRAPRKEKPWGVGTWAPTLGTIEERDVDEASRIAKDREKKGLPFSHSDFIRWTAHRERLEETRGTPTQTLVIIGKPFRDSKTGWTVHVIAEIIQAVSTTEERASREWQLLEGKRHLRTAPKSAEHTELRWVKLGELPENMETGSKKAISSALETLAKKNLITGWSQQ